MRWFLAAVSFALVVSLGVVTATARVNNLDVRRRLQKIEFALIVHHMELGRRQREVLFATEPAELQRRWAVLRRLEAECAAATQLQ